MQGRRRARQAREPAAGSVASSTLMLRGVPSAPLAWLCCVAAASCAPRSATTSPSASPSAPPPAAQPVAAAPRVWAPEEVVAVADGREIREAEVAELAQLKGPDGQPRPRDARVLTLIERHLAASEADRRGLQVEAREVDAAVELIAQQQGLSLVQLQEAVREQVGVSWEFYRQELAAQILALKLVQAALPYHATAAWGVPAPTFETADLTAVQARVLGCLRAIRPVEVKDPRVELPANIFSAEASLGALRFSGDPALPTSELAAAAKIATAGRPLCASLDDAELALTRLYHARGYLEARVKIPWPSAPHAGMTVDVDVAPGPRHVLGELRLDLSAAPKRTRAQERALRRALAAAARPGEPASLSALEALDRAARDALLAAGAAAETRATRVPQGPELRVDLEFRALAGAP